MISTLEKVQEERAFFDSLGKLYPADEHVSVKHERIEGVSCYWFAPERFDENRLIIHLHGGAYSLGSIQSHRAMVSHFASALSARILFIEYSRAPEEPYPTALNEIANVYKTLIQRQPQSEISIIGDSAGGGLAVSLVHKAIESKLPLPANLVLISPWIDLDCNTESYETRKDKDQILSKELLLEHAAHYNNNGQQQANPGQLTFSVFPPLFILVGSNEVLFDDSRLFYQKIQPMQDKLKMKEYPEQGHVWPLTDISSDGSREALADIKQFLY